jgi:hypothetical protein
MPQKYATLRQPDQCSNSTPTSTQEFLGAPQMAPRTKNQNEPWCAEQTLDNVQEFDGLRKLSVSLPGHTDLLPVALLSYLSLYAFCFQCTVSCP